MLHFYVFFNVKAGIHKFNFHIFMNFPSFLLLLIFNLTLLPEVITCIISILACLFRLGLCLFMWPISENIPDICEGNAYSTLFGGVLHRSLLNLVGLYCCSNLLFLLVIHQCKWGYLSINYYCELSISPFNPVTFCFMYAEAPVLNARTFTITIAL